MVMLEIGTQVGVEHEPRYRRDGGGMIEHRFRYAVTHPYEGFHIGYQGTFHRMRLYVVEANNGGSMAYRWSSLCGAHWLWVTADGSCQDISPHPDLCAWCARCQSCERLADPEAYEARKAEKHRAWLARLAAKEHPC